MKYFLMASLFCTSMAFYASALAWDGFDADSADLVEIVTDLIPSPGDIVTINNRDKNESQNCEVISVIRNTRTIEVTVKNENGKLCTLVMEYK